MIARRMGLASQRWGDSAEMPGNRPILLKPSERLRKEGKQVGEDAEAIFGSFAGLFN